MRREKPVDIGNDIAPCAPIPPARPKRTTEPVWEPTIARLTIDGLHCVHCASRIRNALLVTPHVLGAEVTRENAAVEVLFDAARITTDKLASAIRSAVHGSGGDSRLTGLERV